MALYWSASEIASANYCLMRHYLEYGKMIKPRLSMYEKGTLIHRVIEDFWDWKENIKGKKYKNKTPEEFAQYFRGRWIQHFMAAEKSKSKKTKPIIWNSENEKWIIAWQIENIAPLLYEQLSKDGKPLFKEKSFKFSIEANIDGKKRILGFDGRIDEIRMRDGVPVIRDYKTGGMRFGDMSLGHDPQPTFYWLALSAMAYYDREFAEKIGLSSEAQTLMGNPRFLSEKLQFEYCLVKDPKKDENGLLKPAEIKFEAVKRTDDNFFELIRNLLGVGERIRAGNVYPERGKKCDYCSVKKECEEHERPDPNKPKQQMLFNVINPPRTKDVVIREVRQRRFDWTKARKMAEAKQNQTNP